MTKRKFSSLSLTLSSTSLGFLSCLLVALLQLAFQSHLERAAGFAKVVQQGCQGGKQLDVFAGLPIVFILAAQDVARSGIGRHGASDFHYV